MARYKVRPWRNQDELLHVRTNLYLPNLPENLAARRDACDTIDIWRRRLPLPHAISSSSLIAEAQLHHLQYGSGASPMALRALYASALARFVTGFCDINQSSAVKRSMFDVAAGLGMSERWVELRHHITHGGELPSLVVLQDACDGAMGWLWERFWSRLDAEVVGRDLEEQVAKLNRSRLDRELRTIMKRFVDARKGEIKSLGSETDTKGSTAINTAVFDTQRLIRDHDEGPEILASLLVTAALIVPSKRVLGDSMAGAFMLWDALLVLMSLEIRGFLVLLALQLMEKLTVLNDHDETQDPSKEALELWLEHIFTSKAWKHRRSKSDDGLRELRQEVLKECVLAPGHWTRILSQKLLGSIARNVEESDWREVCEAATLDEEQWHESSDQVDLDRKEAVPVQSIQSHVGGESLMQVSLGGWKQYPGKWKPLPIGMPQSAAAA